MFRRIHWRIAVPYVILITVVLIGLAIYLLNVLRDTYLASLRSELTSEARLIGDALSDRLARDDAPAAYSAAVEHYAELLGARVTVIDPSGTVLGESLDNQSAMANHLFRAEIQQALNTGQGSSIRYSDTLGYDMMYAAASVKDAAGRVIGVSRVALSVEDIELHLARLRRTTLTVTLLAAIVAWLLAIYVAERTAQPIRWLTRAAERMGQGDYSVRLIPTTHDEVGTLTHTFNGMAGNLQQTIGSLDQERARLAGVLEHMANGVLITDRSGNVNLINPAACRIFGLGREQALGLSFAQVVRDHRLISLWRECRDQAEERIDVVEVGHRGPLLQVVLTPLRGAEGPSCLVLLQDLTRVRHLETIRRDFISNISHELRTPLASLKALTETLRDSALDDPPAARRFLERIEIEVDSMTQMVLELLELSRIESGRAPVRLAPLAVSDIVLAPVERLRPQAERAGLDLAVNLRPDLPLVLGDAERLQQVMTNLVHNAIKFTPAGGRVTISASTTAEEVVVAVADTGVGIPEDLLPRIFERFYKADRSRSGGGTGLGLAIAKHIVQAHAGRIWVESSEGRGSTFYFSLLLAGKGQGH